VDHETALEAANEALSGSSSSSSSRIASVEFRRVDPLHRRGPALPSLDEPPTLPHEAWQVAATIAVAIATLIFVVTLWLL
jgi:hypothetical protein